MTPRKLALLAAAGLCFGGSAFAKDKDAKLPKPSELQQTAAIETASTNQALAEAVAAKLTGPMTEGSDLSLTTEGGVVTLLGTCRDAAQKKAILQEARVVKGVKMVRDGLVVSAVAQVQAVGTPGMLPDVPRAGTGPVASPIGVGVPPSGSPMVEPAPLGANPGIPADGFAPPLPPHAWPTYAPYNNVSRVGYPTAYPYNAFPFIGPFYPFPKVPIGWRSVTLKWEDGHWWYNRNAVPHDYWRVRFW